MPFGPVTSVAQDIPPEDVIFGSSVQLAGLRERFDRIAESDFAVLIQGESGTGKDVVARLIHLRSPRKTGSFVKIDCPAIPATLIESELFGYEAGAFTGATNAKPGRVELANRGTLFLDEVADMHPSLQAKLLHLLQDGNVCRIGGMDEKKIEVRLICASGRDLEGEIATGNFRQDLFYRINVLNVQLPPLRDRRQDIPALVDYFLRRYTALYNSGKREVSRELVSVLMQHDWPGNVRELENVVKRLVVFGNEDGIKKELLSNGRPRLLVPGVAPAPGLSLKEATKQATIAVERDIILRSLRANNWNRKKTARELRISYRALLYKMRNAGIEPASKPTRGELRPEDIRSQLD